MSNLALYYSASYKVIRVDMPVISWSKCEPRTAGEKVAYWWRRHAFNALYYSAPMVVLIGWCLSMVWLVSNT